MCDGYRTTGEDDRPDLEDEFLCEYVDGTMDPVVRNVFEEYLRANPDLREHIECLRHTRSLLCRYGCRCRAPRDLHDRLRREITCDLINGRIPFQILVSERLKGAASVSTAMAFVLLVGFLAGLTLMEPPDGTPTMVSAAVVSPQSLYGAASDRHVAPKPPTLMLRPRLSPRMDSAPLGAGRTLITKGLEQELRRGVPATYAAAGGAGAAAGRP